MEFIEELTFEKRAIGRVHRCLIAELFEATEYLRGNYTEV